MTALPGRLPAVRGPCCVRPALPPWRARAARSGCAVPCWGTGRTCAASPAASSRKAVSCLSRGTEPRGSGPLMGECWAAAESVEVAPQGLRPCAAEFVRATEFSAGAAGRIDGAERGGRRREPVRRRRSWLALSLVENHVRGLEGTFKIN